ncbi:hypothetical protein [Sphingobacterium sp. LRF_L2]|uniref:HU domain-containing protein n=1 Tax=Sphingobacterium sp. LRF_L2 TaxID=3369421 RepID=UPI003F623D00
MNLGKNVYNLLKRQSEVYVIGLGSFKRNHTPATYDAKRNVYLPPISYIDFDSKSDRGYDFVQYVTQLELVDRLEADKLVVASVRELLQKIREDGQAKLDDLGYLVSYGDAFVFKALDLSGFNYEPVEGLKVVPSKEEIPAPVPVPEQVEEVNVINTAVEPTLTTEVAPSVAAEAFEPFSETIGASAESTGRSKTIWYLLTALMALGILAVIYYYNRKQVEPLKPLVLVDSSEEKLDSLVDDFFPDSLAGQDTSMEDFLGDSTAIQEDKVSVDEGHEALVPKHHTWQIVIGSHKTLEQAYQQAHSYHKKGYPRVRVIPSNMAKNRKKVIWDSYETKQQVDSAILYVQKHIIKDAWPDKIN